MKTTMAPFLSVILVTICANCLFVSASEEPTSVLDIAGKKVLAGIPYYIVASAKGRGGITFECTRNNTCPIEVVKGVIGLSLYFTPVNPKQGVIRESTDLNIIFWYSSDVWKVDSYDRRARQYLLTTGGIVGNPGPKTLRNWFKLGKLERGYKIMHCPSVCKNCKSMCRNVGIFVNDGKLRLALTDKPLKIFFRQFYS